MNCVIRNGKIVTEYGIKEGLNLVIKDDKIEGLFRDSYLKGDEKIIDADGGYVTPGFIDIHSDYIETMASPRPTAVMDFEVGLKESEKVLAISGITTIYHSLSFIKDDEFSKKPIRNRDNVIKLLDEISKNRIGLIRNRFHGRLEIDNYEGLWDLKKYIEESKVDLISIMDHSPGQGQYKDLEIYKDTLKGYRRDITEDEIEVLLKYHNSKKKITFKEVVELFDYAKERGIPVASHDDESVERIELFKGIGVKISEFPITLEAALEAKMRGMFTVGGAPNVLLGGSHAGNLSMAQGVKEGGIDILCSDYYPQGMLHGVFILSERYGMDLGDMFKLVTINPAKAMGIYKEYGSIERGKKADILIIRKDSEGIPIVEKTFVNGKIVAGIDIGRK